MVSWDEAPRCTCPRRPGISVLACSSCRTAWQVGRDRHSASERHEARPIPPSDRRRRRYLTLRRRSQCSEGSPCQPSSGPIGARTAPVPTVLGVALGTSLSRRRRAILEPAFCRGAAQLCRGDLVVKYCTFSNEPSKDRALHRGLFRLNMDSTEHWMWSGQLHNELENRLRSDEPVNVTRTELVRNR